MRPLDGALGDVRPDVAPEQVAQPIPLGEPGDHPVESRLQTPDLGTLVRADRGVDAAVFDLRHRVDDLADRIRNGSRRQNHRRQPEEQRRQRHHQDGHIQRRRTSGSASRTSAAPDRVAITPMGSALHKKPQRTSRANTPGTASRGSRPQRGGTHDGSQGALRQQHPGPGGGRPAHQHAEQNGQQNLGPAGEIQQREDRPGHAPGQQQDRRLAAGRSSSRLRVAPGSVRRRRHTNAAWEPGSGRRPPRRRRCPARRAPATAAVFFSAK